MNVSTWRGHQKPRSGVETFNNVIDEKTKVYLDGFNESIITFAALYRDQDRKKTYLNAFQYALAEGYAVRTRSKAC